MPAVWKETLDRSHFAALDESDPLASYRERFELPSGLLYFDGNSLGPLPHSAKERIRQVTEEQWGQDLIASWNQHGWIDLPRRVGEKIAPLVGAYPDELVVCDSVSVNLFKLLSAAIRLRGRPFVLCQEDHFFRPLRRPGAGRFAARKLPADPLRHRSSR